MNLGGGHDRAAIMFARAAGTLRRGKFLGARKIPSPDAALGDGIARSASNATTAVKRAPNILEHS